MVKACQALAYAHDKGVIHRDLKPANIMVGRFGEVYVMDWGLAKITGKKDLHDIRPKDVQLTSASIRSPRYESLESTPESPLITMDGSVVGTPAYMSPEQARGEVEAVDHLSDIYSLGAILYNLLTGQPPYVEPGARISPHTILGMVIQGPPKQVYQLNPQAPPELIAICERAMARGKKDRYAASLDLAEDLQAFLDHRVVRAYRTGAVAEFRSWVARNRRTAFVAGTSVVVIGLLLTGALVERHRAFGLQESLARQYLRRGQAFCEKGPTARGLHWMARSLEAAPKQSVALRETIRQNLAAWGQQWTAPKAILLHDSLVLSGAFSPDGKRVATGSHNGVVQLWSVETGEALPVTLKHNDQIDVVLFSPDGSRLLTSSDDRTIRFWNADTGAPINSVPNKQEANALTAAFSPDGTRAATGTRDGTVLLWNATTGEVTARMAHQAGVKSTAFSPDGRLLLTGSHDGTARLWNGQSGAPVGPPMIMEGSVVRAVFSPNGAQIATLSGEKLLQLWTTETGQPTGVAIQHHGAFLVEFSPDGKLLLTGAADRTARLWKASTGEAVGAPMVHDGRVRTVCFSVDGSLALTDGDDQTVHFWSVETGQPAGQSLRGSFLLLSSDGKMLMTHMGGHARGLWSAQPRERSAGMSILEGNGQAVAFTPDGRRLLVADARRARWWSIELRKMMTSSIRHDARIWSVTVSPNGKRVLTAGADDVARLWSLEGSDEQLLWDLPHNGDVRTAVFSPDGKLVATASFDRTARLWSSETGKPIGSPLQHPNFVEDVAFSPDGSMLATACGDGIARLWSLKTGAQIGPPMAHRGSVLAVKFFPDGKQIVTGSRDQTARFWNVATGRTTGVLQESSPVEDFSFSRDGKWLATVTGQGVRFWSVATGESVGPPLEQSEWGWEVVFNPGGTLVAGSASAGPARVWKVPEPFRGDLRHARLWVEVLTWQEMDANGVLKWLDRPTWLQRRKQLEMIGGPTLPPL